jgi:hypothetical protein
VSSEEKRRREDAEKQRRLDDMERQRKADEARAPPWYRKPCGRMLRENAAGARLHTADKFTVQLLLGVGVLLLLAGAGLVTFAAVKMSLPNDREARVAEYNAVVAAFGGASVLGGGAAAIAADWSDASADNTNYFDNFGAYPLSFQREKMRVTGTTEGVAKGETVFLRSTGYAQEVPVSAGNKYVFTVNGDKASTLGTGHIIPAVLTTDSKPPSTNIVTATTAQDSGPWYLESVCFVVRKSGSTYVVDARQPSCYYPFGVQQYSASASETVPVSVRVSTDPFLALQRLTAGTGAFAGETAQERNVSAGWTVAIGAIVFLPALLLVVQIVVELHGRSSAITQRIQTRFH